MNAARELKRVGGTPEDEAALEETDVLQMKSLGRQRPHLSRKVQSH